MAKYPPQFQLGDRVTIRNRPVDASDAIVLGLHCFRNVKSIHTRRCWGYLVYPIGRNKGERELAAEIWLTEDQLELQSDR